MCVVCILLLCWVLLPLLQSSAMAFLVSYGQGLLPMVLVDQSGALFSLFLENSLSKHCLSGTYIEICKIFKLLLLCCISVRLFVVLCI